MTNTPRIKSPVNLPTKPEPEFSRLIELLADINLTMDEVDEKLMQEFPHIINDGWHIGSTREKIKKYPLLARTAAEARILNWREVGISKVDGYRVIAEAMKAEKIAPDGSTTKDHDIRLKANDRFMTLVGENVNPAGAKTNITVTGDSSKILIMTSDGKAADFPMRPEDKVN